MPYKFVIVHGYGGNKDTHWFPWLEEKLQEQGHEVWREKMPEVNKDTWRDVICEQLTSDTILIGHSLGSPASLRALEKWNGLPIKAFFSIAGFAQPLDLDFGSDINPFVEEGFDFEKIKNNVEDIFIWESDEDPYVPLEQGTFLHEKLQGERHIFGQRHHLGTWENSNGEFPELLQKIKEVL